MTDLRYPIGRCDDSAPASPTHRAALIDRIAAQPAGLTAAVAHLTPAQLDTPYRPGGWTVRQVAHHVADSHINAYVRIKLALTENHPTIKPYDEARWAETPEYAQPVEESLELLGHLHRRWTTMLRRLPETSFARTFLHPEGNDTFTIDRAVATYAWHGDHHTAHITSLREREGW